MSSHRRDDSRQREVFNLVSKAVNETSGSDCGHGPGLLEEYFPFQLLHG